MHPFRGSDLTPEQKQAMQPHLEAIFNIIGKEILDLYIAQYGPVDRWDLYIYPMFKDLELKISVNEGVADASQ